MDPEGQEIRATADQEVGATPQETGAALSEPSAADEAATAKQLAKLRERDARAADEDDPGRTDRRVRGGRAPDRDSRDYQAVTGWRRSPSFTTRCARL